MAQFTLRFCCARSDLNLSRAASFKPLESSKRTNVLYISPVWPEPSSSAAGVRTAKLIEAMQSAGWEISYLSTSKPNVHTQRIQQQGCLAYYCPPNREKLLEEVVDISQPNICIFDRFIAEEAFSFRIRHLAPAALRVLDLQDLHSLRRAREEQFRRSKTWAFLEEFAPTQTVDLLRELAAIHRSDLALVCSSVELNLLTQKYDVHPQKLHLAPFFVDKPSDSAKHSTFHERQHLVTVGNFRHAPNADSVKWLASELWPLLQKCLPTGTQLHCFGAYGTAASIRQLHKPSVGFHIKGHAESLDILGDYRLCLAPLRFGAGLKGKIVDSWLHGLPVVTTPIGAEGMTQSEFGTAWGGRCKSVSVESFVRDVMHLYTNEEAWNESAAEGSRLVHELFDAVKTMPPVMNALTEGLENVTQLREDNLVGRILWLQKNRATEYFSRWIELKESIN